MIASMAILLKYRTYKALLLLTLIFGVIVTEVFSTFILDKDSSTTLLFALYTLFEFVVIYLFYSNSIYSKRNKLLAKLIFLATIFFATYNLFLGQGLHVYNSYSSLVIDFAIVVYAILYFIELISEKSYINYFRKSEFWFFSGLLFYVCVDILHSGTINQMWQINFDAALLVAYLYVGINILLYLFLFIATLCLIPEKSSSPSSAS